MCGIAGAISLTGEPVPRLEAFLAAANHLQMHRGPDGDGAWWSADHRCGLAHRRLSIIGLDESGRQPMTDRSGRWLTFNGEIYNYRELRSALGRDRFVTDGTDSETILVGYDNWGIGVLDHLRGMYAFGLHDPAENLLLLGRDRLGIKPLCYTIVGGALYFASEAKALLPVLPAIRTNTDALRDYITFQFTLGGKSLFESVHEVPPGHVLIVRGGHVELRKYWDISFEIDEQSSEQELLDALGGHLDTAIDLHLRSDVPVGSYVSGGLDSSLVAALAVNRHDADLVGFVGKFVDDGYDESGHARSVAAAHDFELVERTITEHDFLDNIRSVIRHLDYPLAGPGAFPQYMISQTAATRRKVVLGGQGGDELFGGYVRYLLAYFEAALKGAIDGTLRDREFIVTYDTILASLPALNGYQPMMRYFWQDGLFGPPEARYFRLVDRSAGSDWAELNFTMSSADYNPYEAFLDVFNSPATHGASYFDAMTHFDFKTLLPALLHVEDRMSMAHGLEARVPLLDHELVEFSATIPARTKFRGGALKKVLRQAAEGLLPTEVLDRKDKMGFPVPLDTWLQSATGDFVRETFATAAAADRDEIDYKLLQDRFDASPGYSRHLWGHLCLALWYEEFHDRASEYRALLDRDWTLTNVAALG